MPRRQREVPRTPRGVLLWMLREVEKAFSRGAPGDEAVRQACSDVREWIEREWTDEREQALVQREKARADTAKAEATQILGEAKWKELERMGDEMRQNCERAYDAIEDDFFAFEKESPVWKRITQRLRDAAAKGAAKKNIVDVSNTAKEKASAFVSKMTESDSGPLVAFLKGEITFAGFAEKMVIELSKHIGVKTQETDEEKIKALGALVRFRKGAELPATPASVLVQVSDCAPICLSETKKFLEAMTIKPGAKKYIDDVVTRVDEALGEEQLQAILDKMNGVDPSGGKDQLGQFARALASKDWSAVERLAKSAVVSACISLLPQFKLPPIEANRDGMQYTVKGMSLSQFHLDERNVRFNVRSSLAAIKRGDPVLKIVIDDLSATLEQMQWTFKRDSFPSISGAGVAHAKVKGVCIVLGLQLVKRRKSVVHKIVETVTGEVDSENGTVSSSPSPAPSPTSKSDDWVPQLVLGISRATIDSVKIDFEAAAIYSVLTEMFAKTIRVYAGSLIEDMIVDKTSTYLEKANETFAMHIWDTLSAALEIDVDKLPTEEQAAKRAEQIEAPMGGRKDTYSVTFREEGPLGLALGKWNEFVVVKSFKKAKDGSTLPAEASGKIKIGDILVGFNGGEITSLPLDRVTTRISRSRRPLTLNFAPGDASSMEATKKRNHVCNFRFEEEKLYLLIKGRTVEDRAAVVTGFRPPENGKEGPAERMGVPVGWVLAAINNQRMLDKTFKDTMAAFMASTTRPIDLKFVRDPDFVLEMQEAPVDMNLSEFDGIVVVAGFTQQRSPAETLLADSIQSGDYIVGVGKQDTSLIKFDDIIQCIRSTIRPVEIRFARPGLNGICAAATFGPGPLGMVFYRSSEGRCCFKAFQGVQGPVESTKQVFPGMVLRAINGQAVTSEAQAKELLANVSYPLKLTFRDMEAFEEGGWKND